MRRVIGFENMKKLEPTLRQTLRMGARVALKRRGYSVRQITAPGVVPGARLQVKKSGDPTRRVAVRTSMDRKVGLTRDPETGKWRTIPSAHLVVIAVPAQNNPDCAEVFGFDPKVIIRAFNALERKVLSGKPQGKASKSPLFIALDHQLDDKNDLRSNLKKKSVWSTIVALKPQGRPVDRNAEFADRIKREFAELNGVDIGNVTVNLVINLQIN
jgi:hypothetical protein